MTTAQRIDAFIAKLLETLPTPQESQAPQSWRRLKLSSVLSQIGLLRRSDAALAALERELLTNGIYCDQPLADRSLRRGTWLRFSRTPFPPESMVFEREHLLKALVEAHIGNYGPLRGLVLLGEEVRVGRSRLDLLCEDVSRRERPLVIIELKRAAGGDRLAGQLVRYTEDLRRDPNYAGREVRMVVITAEPEMPAVQLLRGLGVDVQCYRYSIELHKV